MPRFKIDWDGSSVYMFCLYVKRTKWGKWKYLGMYKDIDEAINQAKFLYKNISKLPIYIDNIDT